MLGRLVQHGYGVYGGPQLKTIFHSRGDPVHGFNWIRITKLVNTPMRIVEQYKLDLPIRYDMSFSDFRWRNRAIQKTEIGGFKLFNLNLDVPFCTRHNDKVNAYCGWAKRIVPLMPVPDSIEVNKLGIFVKKWLEKNLQPLPCLDEKDKDILFDEWLNHGNYNGQRKNQIRKALCLYKQSGIDKHFYENKSFIKQEFYEEPKHVRHINSRSDMFKSLIGPCIHEIEKQIFKNKHFIKHLPIDELPSKIKNIVMNHPWILETDYSSFESGFNPEYVDNVECNLWRYTLQNNPDLLNYVLGCYYTTTTINGKQIYTVRRERCSSYNYTYFATGCRMSGEMWTSLANGFSNLMNMKYLCKKYNLKCDGIVEGDDGLFGLDSKIIQAKDFENFGFKIKMYYTQDLHETRFCGNLFDLVNEQLIISPETITRSAWCCGGKYLYFNTKNKHELIRAKAMSLYCLGKFTPIAQSLSLAILRILGPGQFRIEESKKYWLREKYNITEKTLDKTIFVPLEISNENRMIFNKIYGLDINFQLSLEKHYNESRRLEDLFLPCNFLPVNQDQLDLNIL